MLLENLSALCDPRHGQKPALAIAPLVVLMATATAPANAALVFETRSNTNNIEIPRFNPALGTLQSVSLNVTMQSGTTTSSGSHDHTSKLVISNNSVSNDDYDPFATMSIGTSAAGGIHNHSFVTPFYSGAGISLGTFSGTSGVSGSHNHQLNISYQGFQASGTNERLRVMIDSIPTTSLPGHSIASATKSLSFTGGNVTPFEGLSDVVISAGSFLLNSSGQHTHNYTPFSVTLDESGPFGTGSDTFFFSGGTLNTTGIHSHTFDPTFTVTAAFEFAAIPEPSLAGVFLLGTLGLASRHRRRA